VLFEPFCPVDTVLLLTIFCCIVSVLINKKPEALLSQTDRTTPYVSRNVVNCCTTVGTVCTTNPQQIEVMELECYSRPACGKQPRRVDRRRYDQQAGLSTSFADNTIDLP